MPSALRPLQLRSSSAHCARKLAKSKAEVNMGVDAKVVEEKLEEREGEEEEEVKDEEEEEEAEEENNCDKI